jgi:hypothetical protein
MANVPGVSSCNFPASSPLDDLEGMSFEQCAKNIHVMIRISLREWGALNDRLREDVEEERKRTTKDLAESYRSMLTTGLRIGTAAIGGLGIGATILPGAARQCMGLFSAEAKALNYADITRVATQNISAAQEFCKAGVEIRGSYTQGDRTELEGEAQKARELIDRRAKDAHERQTSSDELLQLLAQMNREITDSMRAMTRG